MRDHHALVPLKYSANFNPIHALYQSPADRPGEGLDDDSSCGHLFCGTLFLYSFEFILSCLAMQLTPEMRRSTVFSRFGNIVQDTARTA